MWKVLFTAKAERDIRQMVKQGFLTDNDRRIITTWIRQVKKHGPDSLKNESIWYDHSLKGKFQGYRASAFSYSGRIIYKVEAKKITVIVIKVTPDHRYED